MSVSPQPPGGLTAPKSEPSGEGSIQTSSSPKAGWQHRLLRISLALFTFEIGVFLVLFPWMNSWNTNWFQSLTPLQTVWQNASFRGALTGLGFVNIYIACLQAVQSFRKR